MSEKYDLIYRQEDAVYSEGSPVVITSGVLLMDRLTQKTLVLLKLKSVSDAPISSLTVSITPVCASETEKVPDISYCYTDFNIHRDETFGETTAIVIDRPSVSSYKVRVKGVEFADGECRTASKEYINTPVSRKAPEKVQEDEEDIDAVTDSNSKLKWIIMVMLPVILILALIFTNALNFNRQEEQYQKGTALLEAGKYEQAEEIFTDLGDYDNCAELVQKEIPYRKAQQIMLCADNNSAKGLEEIGIELSALEKDEEMSTALYKKAIELFISLGDYRDSQEQLIKAQKAICDFSDTPVDDTYPEEEQLQVVPEYNEAETTEDTAEAVNAYETDIEVILPTPTPEIIDDSYRFYELCANGELTAALEWLADHDGVIEAQDAWVEIINKCLPFCGSWTLKEGDSYLLTSFKGPEIKCLNFVNKVCISADGGVVMHIVPDGNEEMSYDLNYLPKDSGQPRFSGSSDGVYNFYVLLDKFGNLTITKFHSLNITAPSRSCIFSKVS